MSLLKNNILLVGQQHAGKSTIIRQVLDVITAQKAGMITEPIYSGERISGYRLTNANGLQAIIAREVITPDNPRYVLKVNRKALDKIGSLILTQAQRTAEVIYIDELSGLMDTAEEFQRRVIRCLDGHHLVLAAVDVTPSSFIELLCSRSDVILYPITIDNRNQARATILEYLTILHIPLKQFDKKTLTEDNWN